MVLFFVHINVHMHMHMNVHMNGVNDYDVEDLDPIPIDVGCFDRVFIGEQHLPQMSRRVYG